MDVKDAWTLYRVGTAVEAVVACGYRQAREKGLGVPPSLGTISNPL